MRPLPCLATQAQVGAAESLGAWGPDRSGVGFQAPSSYMPGHVRGSRSKMAHYYSDPGNVARVEAVFAADMEIYRTVGRGG